MIDYNLIEDVWLENVTIDDYPDFADAYIISADYDGLPMSEEMLDELNEDYDYIYECMIEQLKF